MSLSRLGRAALLTSIYLQALHSINPQTTITLAHQPPPHQPPSPAPLPTLSSSFLCAQPSHLSPCSTHRRHIPPPLAHPRHILLPGHAGVPLEGPPARSRRAWCASGECGAARARVLPHDQHAQSMRSEGTAQVQCGQRTQRSTPMRCCGAAVAGTLGAQHQRLPPQAAESTTMNPNQPPTPAPCRQTAHLSLGKLSKAAWVQRSG